MILGDLKIGDHFLITGHKGRQEYKMIKAPDEKYPYRTEVRAKKKTKAPIKFHATLKVAKVKATW